MPQVRSEYLPKDFDDHHHYRDADSEPQKVYCIHVASRNSDAVQVVLAVMHSQQCDYQEILDRCVDEYVNAKLATL